MHIFNTLTFRYQKPSKSAVYSRNLNSREINKGNFYVRVLTITSGRFRGAELSKYLLLDIQRRVICKALFFEKMVQAASSNLQTLMSLPQ